MIKLIITDLDNTMYNWVDFFVPSFNAMVKELSRLTGIKQDTLRASFKRVYQKHKTSEYAFAIEELDVLADLDRGLSVRERLKKYNSAVQAFRKMRLKTLHLYEGVQETLAQLQQDGRNIVGHSQAPMFYVITRLKQLKVEHFFDGVYAFRDYGLPKGTRPEDVRSNEPEYYQTVIPYVKEIDPAIVKPNAETLYELLRSFDANPHEAIYLGDSLHRDIYMAQQCGVHDVYAEYGRFFNPEHYSQLVEITHWTEEDVARELQLKSLNIKPTYTITRFADLLNIIQEIEAATVKQTS